MVKKFNSKHSVQRKFLILSILALLLVASCISVWILVIHNQKIEVSTGEQAPYNKTKKEVTINNGGVPTESSTTGKNPSNDKYSAPTNNEGIVITPSQSGDQVIVSTQLIGYSDGLCSLRIENGTEIYSNQAKVVYAPGFSTCAGFSIPTNSLGPGTWHISLEVTSGSIKTAGDATYVVQ